MVDYYVNINKKISPTNATDIILKLVWKWEFNPITIEFDHHDPKKNSMSQKSANLTETEKSC